VCIKKIWDPLPGKIVLNIIRTDIPDKAISTGPPTYQQNLELSTRQYSLGQSISQRLVLYLFVFMSSCLAFFLPATERSVLS